jgi:CubicO group peptidase (beta-lactamase class C family)
MKRRLLPLFLLIALLASMAAGPVRAQETSVDAKLAGFDETMAQIVKDWNVPGIGVGIVVKDKLVFAKGYGYRDYGKKLPFTAEPQRRPRRRRATCGSERFRGGRGEWWW